MRKFICLAIAGFAATALTLATPAESRADDDHRHGRRSDYRQGSRFSIGIGNGGFNLDYGRGGYGQYYAPNYGYGRYAAPSYGGYYTPGYGSHYLPRPVIVQPTEMHWTPYRGWHEHGHILVPHRGHYHVRPY